MLLIFFIYFNLSFYDFQNDTVIIIVLHEGLAVQLYTLVYDIMLYTVL